VDVLYPVKNEDLLRWFGQGLDRGPQDADRFARCGNPVRV